MEKNTLIKIGALLIVIAFVLELFITRSSVTSSTQQPSENNTNESSVYGAGNTTATLTSYTDYLNVFKPGKDLSANSSLKELSSIAGVGYVNQQGGALTLVLGHEANASFIAGKVKEKFPDLNVTANALFSLPSQINFKTSLGDVNVSAPFILSIEIEPNIDVGDNVTISLVGVISGNKFVGSPVAKIIPTTGEVVTNAVVNRTGEDYSAVVMLPWGVREVNESRIRDELSSEVKNLTVNYTPKSYVVIPNLHLESNETVERIANLSYVVEVNGDVVHVEEKMNDSGKFETDLKGIVGSNTTFDYPTQVMEAHFSSANFSKENLSKTTGGELILYRKTILKLSEKMRVAGVDYEVPGNTSFEVMLLDSYSIGSNVTVALKTGTIGKRIVSIELKDIVG